MYKLLVKRVMIGNHGNQCQSFPQRNPFFVFFVYHQRKMGYNTPCWFLQFTPAIIPSPEFINEH